jgi:hypothetical protein
VTKLPEEPDRALLRKLGPDGRVLPRGSRIWRVYFQGGPHPTAWNAFRAFGPAGARFDHHEPPPRTQARAILYGAAGTRGGITCLAEVFQSTRTINRRRNEPWLVVFRLSRAVRVHDLMGVWPTRAGASMNINSGPHERARNWSRAIYELYPGIEGVCYGSAMHANEPALALYERALTALPPRPEGHWSLLDPRLRDRVLNAAARLGYVVWPP